MAPSLPTLGAPAVTTAGAASIGAATIGATITSALASAGIGAAINIGVYFLNRWLNPRPDAPAVEFEINPQVVPARYVFGQQRTGGVPFYWGVQGGYLYLGLAISEGECESIERIYINGQAVRFDRRTTELDGGASRGTKGDILVPPANDARYRNAAGDPLWEIYEYFRADGTQGADLRDFAPTAENTYLQGPDGRYYLAGTPEQQQAIDQADPEFVTENQGTGTNNDGSAVLDASQVEAVRAWETALPAWTSDHQMNGISWIMARFHQPAVKAADDRVYNRVPEIELVVKGIKPTFPDPDTSADEADRVTEWTNNAAAIRWWWLTTRRGVPESMIDIPSFRAAYARCQEEITVTLPAAYTAYQATSRRYQADGIIQSGESVAEIEAQLDLCWQGFVVEHGDKLHFRPGVPAASRTTHPMITDDDIVDTVSITPWPPLQERVNIITGSLRQARTQDYDVMDLVPFKDTAQATLDGEDRALNVEYRFVSEPVVGGRLQATHVRRLRERKGLVARILPGDGLSRHSMMPTDLVPLIHTEAGYATATNMQIDQIIRNEDESLTLHLRILRANTYADTLHLPPLLDEKLAFPSSERVPDVENLTPTNDAQVASDGTVVPIVRLAWDDAEVLQTEIQVDGRPHGTSPESSYIVTGLVVGRDYTIRARHSHSGGRVGAWNSLAHTVTGDTMAPDDITGVDIEALPAGLKIAWTNPADTDLSYINVFVGTAADPPKVAEISASSYDALGLDENIEYHVRLQPVDHSGNEGNKTTVASETTLSAVSTDERTPDAPTMRVVPQGLQVNGLYSFLLGVEPSSDIGRASVQKARIQVSRSATGHTVAGGWPVSDVFETLEPNATAAFPYFVNEYGLYFFSAQIQNWVTGTWSEWSSPIQGLTTSETPENDVPNEPTLQVERASMSEIANLTITLPTMNWQSIWGYIVQVDDADIPDDLSHTTGLRGTPEAQGTGTVTAGSRVLTDLSATWTVDEHVGRTLFTYVSIDTATGEIGFPLATPVLANTETTITVADQFRISPGEQSPETVNYLLSEFGPTSTPWLRTGIDLTYFQTHGIALDANGAPPQFITLQIECRPGSRFRVSAGAFYGRGPWSKLTEASEQIPDVENFTPTDNVQISDDGTAVPIVRLAWDAAEVFQTEIEVDGRAVGASPADDFILTGLVSGQQYTIRARHTHRGGETGAWASEDHTVGSDTNNPGNITGVSLTALPEGLKISWTNPSDDDFSHVNVFVGTAADPPKVAEIAANNYDALGLVGATEYNVRLQPVDQSGNEGNKTTTMMVDTLESPELDDRTPAAPTISVFGKGVGGDGLYIIGVGITPSGDITRSAIDQCEIVMAEDGTNWTAAAGFTAGGIIATAQGNVVDVIDFFATAYGTYRFTARLHNPDASGDEWSEWTAVVDFTTEPGTEDNSVPSRPVLSITRPGLGGEVTQVTIRRPHLDSRTLFLYELQVSTREFESSEKLTTQIRDVSYRGSGLATIGGNTFTDTDASWTVDELKGRVLYIYRWINTDDGSVGFPLANTILSNTATVITIEPGDPYRLPADAVAPIDDDDRQFDYIISDSIGQAAWLQTPDDLFLYRDVVAVSPGVRSTSPAAVETRVSLSIPENSLVQVRGANFYGRGPWSEDAEVLAADGLPGVPEPIGSTPNHPDMHFEWPEVIGAQSYEWRWLFGHRSEDQSFTPVLTSLGSNLGASNPTGTVAANTREVVITDPPNNYKISGESESNRRSNYVILFSVRAITEDGQMGEWGYSPAMVMVDSATDVALTPPTITISESGGSIDLSHNAGSGEYVFGRISEDGDPVSFADEYEQFTSIDGVSNPVAGRTYFWEFRRGNPRDNPFSSSVFVSHVAGQSTETTVAAPTGLTLELVGGVLVANWDAVTGVDRYEWDLQGVFGRPNDWKRTDQLTISKGNIRNNIPYRFYLRAVTGGVASTIVSANLTASGIQEVVQVLATAAPPTPTGLSLSQRVFDFGGSQTNTIRLDAKWTGASSADRYNFKWAGVDASGLTRRPSLSGSTTRQRWSIFIHRANNTGDSATFTVEAENQRGKSGSVSASITMG